MMCPGVLIKQSFVFILSGFEKTEAHLFNTVSQSIHFVLLNTKAESLEDYRLYVTSSRSLAVCLGFHLGSLIIGGDPLGFYDKLREFNQAIFLQSLI